MSRLITAAFQTNVVRFAIVIFYATVLDRLCPAGIELAGGAETNIFGSRTSRLVQAAVGAGDKVTGAGVAAVTLAVIRILRTVAFGTAKHTAIFGDLLASVPFAFPFLAISELAITIVGLFAGPLYDLKPAGMVFAQIFLQVAFRFAAVRLCDAAAGLWSEAASTFLANRLKADVVFSRLRTIFGIAAALIRVLLWPGGILRKKRDILHFGIPRVSIPIELNGRLHIHVVCAGGKQCGYSEQTKRQ